MRDTGEHESPDFSPFVSPEALFSSGENAGWRFLDARGRKKFEEGHLPGAVNLPAATLNPAQSGAPRLVAPERLKARLDELGVGAGAVIIYGSRGGADAAHVWWTLYAYGHRAALILDGGIDAWIDAGGEIERASETETNPPPPDPAPFVPRLDTDAIMTGAELRRRLHDPALAILDTRSQAEYSGREVAARRGGHIPGARLYSWDSSIDEHLRLRPREQIRAGLAEPMRHPEIVTYCQSGVRAAHTFAVLTMLGHGRPRLYLASWAEWGNSSDMPVEDNGADPEAGEDHQ